MNKYIFTLDAMTIGDLHALMSAGAHNSIVDFLPVVDRLTVGGVYGLSHTELQSVVAAFSSALATHLQQAQQADTADAVRLLRSALGE